jgi:hypothetical protein
VPLSTDDAGAWEFIEGDPAEPGSILGPLAALLIELAKQEGSDEQSELRRPERAKC